MRETCSVYCSSSLMEIRVCDCDCNICVAQVDREKRQNWWEADGEDSGELLMLCYDVPFSISFLEFDSRSVLG